MIYLIAILTGGLILMALGLAYLITQVEGLQRQITRLKQEVYKINCRA